MTDSVVISTNVYRGFPKDLRARLDTESGLWHLDISVSVQSKKNTMNYSTFGPWKSDPDGYVCAPGGLICELIKHDTDRETEANGRLIASAPDMLSALTRLTHPMADDEDLAFAHAVIARALGTKLAKA